jgi:hypothetical protein
MEQPIECTINLLEPLETSSTKHAKRILCEMEIIDEISHLEENFQEILSTPHTAASHARTLTRSLARSPDVRCCIPIPH